MKHNITFSDQKKAPLKNIVWLSDLHLDAAKREDRDHLFDLIQRHHPDILLIGGDVSNGMQSFAQLEVFSHLFEIPLHFVLGNHDYYFGSIAQNRKIALELCERFSHLHYLTYSGVMPLTEKTALIGHDGWSDGRAGNFLESSVLLNDYFYIEELKNLSQEERLRTLNSLGTESALALEEKLLCAFENYDYVVILTHPPPFVEACYYGDHPSDENWQPHFVCQAVGDVIKEQAAKHKDKHLLVLCGHTHTGIDVQLMPNLRVLSGESALGNPSIQGIIYIH